MSIQDADRIVYGYDAGSVPPMHYERLELLAQPGELRVRRWEGERSPVEETVPLSDTQFGAILAALPALGLVNAPAPIWPADAPTPTGGDTEWVRIEARGRTIVGGGHVAGDVAGLRHLLTSFLG